MAGSITVTTSRDGPLTKYSCACTSDGSGDVNGENVPIKAGEIAQVVVTPDSGGTQPTNLFDLTLTLEGGGSDLLGGGGADLSNATPTVIGQGPGQGDLPVPVPSGNVRPVIANAGASKGVTVDIYVR